MPKFVSILYMKHENKDYKIINDLAFAPYEDFLGIGIDGGIYINFKWTGIFKLKPI